MLPKRFLFRFSAPCFHRQKLWTARGARLKEEYRLPGLVELEGRTGWADVRAAWSEAGIALTVHVAGKKQPLWCRPSRPEDSDSVQFWIDTRDVHNVHRASRFCHRFLLLPTGGGRQLEEPVVQWMPIHRARQHPLAIPAGQVQALSEITADGYKLDVLLKAGALTGFEPGEHPGLGFNYAVLDRELGEETFTVASPMPYQEDPSLWATLELVK